MKKNRLASVNQGFTLIELLVVIAIIAILAGLLLPALARAKTKARIITNTNNKKQLQLCHRMYSNDYGDVLMPNSPGGGGWASGTETWPAAAFAVTYYNSLMAPYAANQLQIYGSPFDTIQSTTGGDTVGGAFPNGNGKRIRSVSMNSQMNATEQDNSGWAMFVKYGDIAGPLNPTDAWIFMDETMYTLNDGFLQMNLDTPEYPDVPAAYDNGGNNLAFGDGHVEWHQWRAAGQAGLGLLNCPYTFNSTGKHWPAVNTSDPDWVYLKLHTSFKQTGP